MFPVPLKDVTFDLIEAIVDNEMPEGDEFEIKTALPSRDGNPDPWMTGGDRIGDKARNELIEEVIAFANAHGGTLIVGITESNDAPKRAASISLIPRCHDLADRFAMQCRDMIDPQLPVIEVAGVAADDEGNGVLIVRVPRSRMAPHRHDANKECYVRRADRSEKMTMREIQDLTLNVERGMAALDARISEFRKMPRGLHRIASNQPGVPWGACATLVPVDRLFIERPLDILALHPKSRHFSSASNLVFNVSANLQPGKPIVRGVQGRDFAAGSAVVGSVFGDGAVDFAMCFQIEHPQDGRWTDGVRSRWVIALTASAMCMADLARRQADSPGAEYAMEVQIYAGVGNFKVRDYGSEYATEFRGMLPEGTTTLPRYSLGGYESFSQTINLVEQDFWHLAGRICNEPVDLIFPNLENDAS